MTDILSPDFEFPQANAVAISELIEEQIDNCTLDRRGKEYKQWKNKMNDLIDYYNKVVGFSCYKNL